MRVSARRVPQVSHSTSVLWTTRKQVVATSVAGPLSISRQVGSDWACAAVTGLAGATWALSATDEAQQGMQSALQRTHSVEQPRATPKTPVQCCGHCYAFCSPPPVSEAANRCTKAQASQERCAVWLPDCQQQGTGRAVRAKEEIAAATLEKLK